MYCVCAGQFCPYVDDRDGSCAYSGTSCYLTEKGDGEEWRE